MIKPSNQQVDISELYSMVDGMISRLYAWVSVGRFSSDNSTRLGPLDIRIFSGISNSNIYFLYGDIKWRMLSFK